MGPERLSDLFAAVYRRRVTVLLVLAGAIGGAFAFLDRLPERWRADAAFFIPEQPSRLSLTSPAANVPSGPVIPNTSESLGIGLIGVASSGAVHERVAERIPGIDAQALRSNLIFDIDRHRQLVVSAYDSKRERAVVVANEALYAMRDLIQEMAERGPRATLELFRAEEPAAWVAYQEARDALVTYLSTIHVPDPELDLKQMYQDRTRYQVALGDMAREERRIEAQIPAIEEILATNPEEWKAMQRTFGPNSVYENLVKQLAALDTDLAVQRLRFTEETHAVQSLLRERELVQARLDAELERVELSMREAVDPEARRLVTELTDLRIAQATLEPRRQVYQAELAAVEEKLDQVPLNRAEIGRLETEISRRRRIAENFTDRIQELELQLRRGLEFTWIDKYRLATERQAVKVPGQIGVFVFAGLAGTIVGVLLALAQELMAQMRRRRPF